MNRRDMVKLLDSRIDHYTPYRPITDSPEAQEVRRVLTELRNIIDPEGKYENLY